MSGKQVVSSNVLCDEYMKLVGFICHNYSLYIEGKLQDLALTVERSSSHTERNRLLGQQRDGKQQRKSIENMREILDSHVERFSGFFDEISKFVDLRNKYAHAHLVLDDGAVCVQHLPHMNHRDAGAVIQMDTALFEMRDGLNSFKPFSDVIESMCREAEKNIGPDTGFRISKKTKD
ncbi:hypothetical protein [Corynebacterium suranareeae]|nr:hypothetical protein [Corynebacterium suranareeae]